VVLFDEVEKAHVDVFNLLLQVGRREGRGGGREACSSGRRLEGCTTGREAGPLPGKSRALPHPQPDPPPDPQPATPQILDDGRVTDSQGRVVSFKNAIIILTSNLGSAEVFNYTYKKRAAAQDGSMAGACGYRRGPGLRGAPCFRPGLNARRCPTPHLVPPTSKASSQPLAPFPPPPQTPNPPNPTPPNPRPPPHLNNLPHPPHPPTHPTPNPPEMRELVMEKVRKHFQPEFINRIDEFIIFEPLTAAQIETIVRLQVRGVGARVAEKKMKLALHDSAVRCEFLWGVG
jgi:hypothetical protein